MTALDLLLVAAIGVGMSVQGAIGFGFAFFVAPAAFAVFDPEEAVTLVLILALAINCLVLFAERRIVVVAREIVLVTVLAAIPGTLVGAWIVTVVDEAALQFMVGVVILAGAMMQGIRASGPPAPDSRPAGRGTELIGGFWAGVLTTSVSVNGPALVLTFTRAGLRGGPLRDSLAAALLGISAPAIVVVFAVTGSTAAVPPAWVLLAAIPAVLAGHRFGAAVFRRLDDASHHRAVLAAAAVAGLLSIAAALI